MRWARRAMLLLMLGFVTTVAVAWGIAAWLPQKGWEVFWTTNPHTGPDVRYVTTLMEHRARGAVRREWSVFHISQGRPSYPPFAHAIEGEGAAPAFVSDRSVFCRWGEAEVALFDVRRASQAGCEHAVGWPALAGWYSIANGSFRVEGGVHVSGSLGTATRIAEIWKVRGLPLRPIPIGLATNTVFYALVWLAMTMCLTGVRMAVRRRRGRCVGCAYDLAGLGDAIRCPECGRAIRARVPLAAPSPVPPDHPR